MKKTVFIKDIRPGDKISDFFIVAEKNSAFSQKGTPYLNLRLRDRTGELNGKVWDNVAELEKRFRKGDIVFLQARAVSYKNATQLSVLNIRPAQEEEIEIADYLEASSGDIEAMFRELGIFVDKVKSPSLRALLKAFFDDQAIREGFKRAPAAKAFHHNYIGGLLEHTLSVVRLVDMAADHYGQVDRDILITGAILHDIGKIQELSFERLLEYTDSGRLIGHIVMGVEMLDKKISGLEDFPEDQALALRHILLSHHGVLEFGSPKRPKTVEALIVHHMDDMDAKVKAFRQSIAGAAEDEESPWTPYHRLLERYIYKG